MELYLRWLAKYEQEKDEDPPMGLILCTGKSTEHIELLELGKSGIHVAEYLTVLLPRKVLEEKFRQSVETARERNIANIEIPIPPLAEQKRIVAILDELKKSILQKAFRKEL